MKEILLYGNPEERNNRFAKAFLHDDGAITIKVWDAGEKKFITVSLIKEESDKLIEEIKSL